MKGRKPFGSRFKRTFLVVLAALGIGSSGLMLDNLPKNPATDTQKITTFSTSTGLHGYNISPSDQFWKQTLSMKSTEQKTDELVTAAQNGDSWRTRALFEHGALARSDQAAQALSIASLRGDNDVVTALLQNGVDPTANDGQALISALRGYNTQLALQYLNLGVPANSQNGEAMVLASVEGNTVMMQALIDHGGAVDAQQGRPLSFAAALGNGAMVSTLLANGADATADQSMALRMAAEMGQTGTMQQLITAGADVSANNSEALRMAAASGSNDAVKLILQQQNTFNFSSDLFGLLPTPFTTSFNYAAANVHANGDEALQLAVVGGYNDVANTLIANGADMNAGGGMPLSLSVFQGNIPMTQLLIQRGVDVNAGDGLALYTAVSLGDTQMAQMLMQNGANADLRGGAIKTAATTPLMQQILQSGGTQTPDAPAPQGPLF